MRTSEKIRRADNVSPCWRKGHLISQQQRILCVRACWHGVRKTTRTLTHAAAYRALANAAVRALREENKRAAAPV